jgi:hypothetical protein
MLWGNEMHTHTCTWDVTKRRANLTCIVAKYECKMSPLIRFKHFDVTMFLHLLQISNFWVHAILLSLFQM